MTWLIAIVPLVVSALLLGLRMLARRAVETAKPTPAETAIVEEGAETVAETKAETTTRIEEIRNDTNAGLGNRLHALRERGRVRK